MFVLLTLDKLLHVNHYLDFYSHKLDVSPVENIITSAWKGLHVYSLLQN